MEFVISDKVVADCNRTKAETSYVTELQKKATDYQLSKKLKNLEFYRDELISHKENLNLEMNQLLPLKNRIIQTKNSLEYPKQTSLKCLEMRDDRIGEDLRIDNVETELKTEISNIEDTLTSFANLLPDVEEQLREYRSFVYVLEQDLEKKEAALAVEKQNFGIKITDLCLPLDSKPLLVHSKYVLNTNNDDTNWETRTENLMNKSKISVKAGRKLRFRVEELLTDKIKDLINQHNRCNQTFQKRIAYYKDVKNNLEKKLSKINEQIFQMKQNMKELGNAIAEKEPYMSVAKIRLSNRMNASQPELLGDNVEDKLMKEIKGLEKVNDNLLTKYSLAQTTLFSLNKAKDHLEREIRVKTNSVKIDEVQCFTVHSSVHYHIY